MFHDSALTDQPRFCSARSVVAEALAELQFPEEISVSEATNRHRVLSNAGAYSGPWADSPYDMKFLDRPMDCLGAESEYDEVVVMGPAQTAKSEIGNNWDMHSILYDPADRLFISPSKDLTRSYVTTQFNKMLDAMPELRARQLSGPSSDNIELKQFKGCDLHFLFPGGPSFRARPFPRGRLDDYDEISSDIGDQGDALGLMRGRMASFIAYGRTKIYINSSPKLGRYKGIEALVAAGTDENLYVDCLMCHEPFLLDDSRLQYDGSGTPADAAASAAVICPSPECGGVHLPSDKRALLARKRWVGKGEEAVSFRKNRRGKKGKLLPNSRASFRFNGLFGMRPWTNIAEIAREAEIKYELEQDDAGLKSYAQTVIGKNYTPPRDGEAEITEDMLIDRAKSSPYVMGEVPPGPVVLINAIDLAANRFEVATWGFGPGFRAWLIDRYAVLTIEDNGHERPLKPFTRPEDWAVLHRKVLSRTYPVAGSDGLTMKVLNTVVDTGGLDDATDNAFEWWHAMIKGDVASGRRALPPTAITLFKGGNNPRAKMLPPPKIDAKRQIKGAPQCEMFIPNVNRIKDVLDVRLNRREDGSGFISFPHDIDPAYLAELKAEHKVDNQWVREPHRANETWDLYVMAYTALLRFGSTDASLSWVPPWARPPKGGPKKLESPENISAESKLKPVSPPENVQKKLVRKTNSSAQKLRSRRRVRVRGG